MLEHHQDTTLLHGAFLSAGRTVNDEGSAMDSFCEIEDSKLENILEIVTKSISKILYLKLDNDKGGHQRKISKCRRMHAVIFYTVLKSCGIACDAADRYYETVLNLLPALSWKFYARLMNRCNWSDYFIECVIQLPEDIFTLVMQSILHEAIENDHEFNLLHSVTQASIQRLFISKNLIYLTRKECPFDFNFQISRNATKNVNDNQDGNTHGLISQQKNSTLNDIYKCLFSKSLTEFNICLARLVIQAIVTILKLSVDNQINESNMNVILQELSELVTFSENYLLSDSCQFLIKESMNNFKSNRLFKEYELTISGCSVESFSTFILYYYWKDCSKFFTSNQQWQISIDKITEGLYFLNPLINQNDKPIFEEHVKLLLFTIQRKLPGFQYAVKMILQHEIFLQRDDVFDCIEKEPGLLTKDSFILLISAIRKINLNKNRYVKLLIDQCKTLTSQQTNKLLGYMSENNFMDMTFKLENFSSDLLVFLNYTSSLEKAEEMIGHLCMQSAEEVLVSVIKQAVRNGNQSVYLIKALKFVSAACLHKRPENNLSILMHCLQYYFHHKSLQPYEIKNIEYLIGVLIEDQEKLNFPFDEFLGSCIPQNISPKDSNNLTLCFNTMNMCMKSKEHCFFSDLQSKNMTILIATLIQVISYGIDTYNGHLNEIALTSLNLISAKKENLLSEKDQKFLNNFIVPMTSLVELYVAELLHKDIDPTNLSVSQLWVWMCIKKENKINILEEKLLECGSTSVYMLLVTTIAPLMSHFTSSEWLHSSLLIEQCFSLPSFKIEEIFPDFVVWNLPNGNMRFKLCGVIRCLVEVILLIKTANELKSNWVYIINCFANVVKNSINKDEEFSPNCVILIWWEICFLASNFGSEEMIIFKAVLLDLLRKISVVKDNQVVNLKLLSAAIKNIPYSDDTYALLEQLK